MFNEKTSKFLSRQICFVIGIIGLFILAQIVNVDNQVVVLYLGMGIFIAMLGFYGCLVFFKDE